MVIFHLRVEPLELLSFLVPQLLFSGFVISKDTFNLIVNIIFWSVDACDSPPVSYEQSHPGPPTAQLQVFPEVQKSSSRQDISFQILYWLFSSSGFKGRMGKLKRRFWKYFIQGRIAKNSNLFSNSLSSGLFQRLATSHQPLPLAFAPFCSRLWTSVHLQFICMYRTCMTRFYGKLD